MDLKEILQHHIIDHVWSWLNLGALRLPVSKHFLMMIIGGSLLSIAIPAAVRSRNEKLRIFRGLIETIVVFLRDEVVHPNIGHKTSRYLPYFCTLFFFILVCNLLGLVPFGSTATGNIAVTGGMALTTFALINLAGIREQGFLNYIRHIVPSGVPGWLVPLLFPIELIGLVTKTLALCIRLFANMIAGHIVILALLGLIFMFGAINPWLGVGITAPAAIFLILFVSLLELFVAVLQAYIFTFLTAIFVGASMHSH
ncbi:MAG: F0F1 ATP synthase subunit A [Elusimicrobia bacterium]|nr:F0F1 ATP synthase subunit A [Elusimicrobiota bacterium]